MIDIGLGGDMFMLLGLVVSGALGCVIMIVDDERPTAEMVRAGFKANPNGAGFAWRDTMKDGTKKSVPIVRWKKGITDVDEVVDMAAKLPLPYILHCRIPSIGGPSLELNHPFPVSKDVSVDLEGWTKGEVLFHNGTWHGWNNKMYEAALLRGIKLPRAPFSDTRMMAWVYNLLGRGFLDDIDEKVIVFGPTDEPEVFGRGRGWTCVNKIWCSNDGFRRHLFENRPQQQQQPRPVVMGPQERIHSSAVSGGDRNPAGFRNGPAHVGSAGSSQAGENLKRANEGSPAGAEARAAAGIVAAVSRIGETNPRRHSLIEDEEFQAEYARLVNTRPGNIIGNPKRFRSSGRGGDDSADLERRRMEAARGITRVL